VIAISDLDRRDCQAKGYWLTLVRVLSGGERGAGLVPISSYLICTNPRSGSWLLSDGLAATLVAGNPREWFNVLEEQTQRARWRLGACPDVSYLPYFNHVLKSATTTNGICGVKLHYYQLADFARNMGTIEKYRGLPFDALFSAAFPKPQYIWLTRRDKVRQAISYHRACQTKEWWLLNDRPAAPDGRARINSTFDPQAIAAREKLLIKNDLGWQRFFEDSGIEPLVVTYEEVAADYPGTIRKVLGWLGIPEVAAISIPPARFIRQADSQTDEWRARYLEWKAAGGCLPDSVAVAEPIASFPPALKHWIAQGILGKVPDAVLIDALVDHGYGREQAARGLAHAAADPYLLAASQRQELLDKAMRLLTAFDKLARLDPAARAVQRRPAPSRAEFCARYYAANRPVILTGLMDGWPAMTLWTPAYLKNKAGAELVEIMANREADPHYELNGERHKRLIHFADYVDMVYSGLVTNDYYMVAGNRFFSRDGARPLLADFAAFPEYLDPAAAGQQCFFWFGPAGTVTPLHHDACNLLACQVSGRKNFRLVPASQWPLTYTDARFYSGVDAEQPDLSDRPGFGKATVLDLTLEPGEVLFIPVGWSHQVRTLEPSIMISFTNFVFPNHYEW
jgi:LPS sulfotransferase NodH